MDVKLFISRGCGEEEKQKYVGSICMQMQHDRHSCYLLKFNSRVVGVSYINKELAHELAHD